MGQRYGVPVLGCTSAIAWGDATAGHVAGACSTVATSIIRASACGIASKRSSSTSRTDGQPYVSISAAGVLLGGVTAMNASGLSLVVHQHIACTDFDLDGLPIGVVGDEIMRHAKSLDDARRMLDAHTPNGAWTYVITSARENRVMAYEVTSDRRAIVWPRRISANGLPGRSHKEGGVFGYSNVYLHKDLHRRRSTSIRRTGATTWRASAARTSASTTRTGRSTRT